MLTENQGDQFFLQRVRRLRQLTNVPPADKVLLPLAAPQGAWLHDQPNGPAGRAGVHLRLARSGIFAEETPAFPDPSKPGELLSGTIPDVVVWSRPVGRRTRQAPPLHQ